MSLWSALNHATRKKPATWDPREAQTVRVRQSNVLPLIAQGIVDRSQPLESGLRFLAHLLQAMQVKQLLLRYISGKYLYDVHA